LRDLGRQVALAIRQQALGPRHPDTAISLWWMSTLLEAEGKLRQARDYLAQALAIFEAALPDHPNTATVRRNLAWLDEQLRRKGL
jgi:hypothetical protein